MVIKKIEDFKLTDRNKASARVSLEIEESSCIAEWVFYLQADYCVSIRAGRIMEGNISVDALEKKIFEQRVAIKTLVKPEIVRVRAERRAMLTQT
ncbi:MAG TPA: hypothetical protein VN426_02565 [Syntrophomonadaceae bacterium]|nr:hypothetical protein [Syntrophomonadaceae bacterium]